MEGMAGWLGAVIWLWYDEGLVIYIADQSIAQWRVSTGYLSHANNQSIPGGAEADAPHFRASRVLRRRFWLYDAHHHGIRRRDLGHRSGGAWHP